MKGQVKSLITALPTGATGPVGSSHPAKVLQFPPLWPQTANHIVGPDGEVLQLLHSTPLLGESTRKPVAGDGPAIYGKDFLRFETSQ